ncbi:MAG: hypothetical protein ABEJ73_00395 [Haloplanus sp.]
MPRLAPVYAGALLVLSSGIAALLVGEFFEGGDFLVTVGGGAALVAIGVLTAAIARESPPDATGEH